MDVTRTWYYREIGRNLNTRGKRKLRRYIRRELPAVKTAITDALAAFKGKRLKDLDRTEVHRAIIDALDDRVKSPLRWPQGPAELKLDAKDFAVCPYSPAVDSIVINIK